MSDINVSNAGTEDDDRHTVIQQFMRELCRRDQMVNTAQGGNSSVFTIAEIREKSVHAFNLGTVSGGY